MSENIFLKRGNTFLVSSKEAMDSHDVLPAANYVLKFNDELGQFFLETMDEFTMPKKVYGDTLSRSGRVLETFTDRKNGTGVMLAGEKGSGKTLLARQISLDAAEDGIPTIIINTPFSGDRFNAFIQNIHQPCVILFDEFEKMYSKGGSSGVTAITSASAAGTGPQEAILTLLDGTFQSKKLFVFTVNNKWAVNEHMLNRPGRIYYMFEFSGLSAEFIREYCEDNLQDTSHISRIIDLAGAFEQFNFDMLAAIVEEMNRYNETPSQAMEFLNTKPEFSRNQEFTVSVFVNGKKVPKNDLGEEEININPLKPFSYQISWKSGGTKKAKAPDPIFYDAAYTEDEDDDGKRNYFVITQQELVSFKNGEFTFDSGEGVTVVLRKSPERRFNIHAF